MSARLQVPADTARRQASAADPSISAWVSANAGSGKTHVLSRRVIRLLLAGTDPSKILCLTYTRAAAANMANRVFEELSAWTRLDDAGLAAAIEDLTGRRPAPATLERGRRLFARALETPGGLKIQTVHAFCEAVLHRFPLEANIAGHFELLDGRMEAALFAEARRSMLSAAGRGVAGLADAFATVLSLGGEAGLDRLLSEIVANRDGIGGFVAQMKAVPVAFAPLFECYGFAAGDAEAAIAGEAWPLEFFDAALAREFGLRAAEAGKQHAQTFADNLAAAVAEDDPVVRLRKLARTFLTADAGGWRPKAVRLIAAKGVGEHFPGFAERFEEAAERVRDCAERHALFRMLDASRAALLLAEHVIDRYETLKSARGFLDFNDLIARTIRLLERGDVGPWIQYKLDRGIDHILVDEAQDTSPDQWRIVNLLADEFFAGRGASDDVTRTVFAVGDEKQSIYSFQGAAPEAFAASGERFHEGARGAGVDFERVELHLSFRSTPDVLSAVDLVFADERAHKGLSRDPGPTVHEPIRARDPGYVEIWESIGATDIDEPEDWTQPVDHASAPAVQLAERIAATIEGWLSRGELLEGRGRPLKAGDVMVLVRKRDRFVHALSRSLKNRGVAVAGADRLNLAQHIAVQDLIALGRFVLQPEDDLSLAALLRSPVFALGEEALFDLAARRPKGGSLFASLRQAAGADEALAEIADRLLDWRGRVDFHPVFEFYAGILSADGVRGRMIARLGHEAGDVLDEFLRFAFAEERAGLPGLEAFLATLESAGPDIKREMDQTRDEVRIMTVHAAKGLEAPVVFLVDSGSAPFFHAHLPRLVAIEPEGAAWQRRGFLWRAGRELENPVSRAVAERFREKAEEEYRRLLYVGMTRAEDRLIVCGYHGKRPPSDTCWHALVGAALLPRAEELTLQPGGFAAHRYRVTEAAAVASAADGAAAAPPRREPPPERLREKLPAAPELPRPLAPSGAALVIEPSVEPAVSRLSPVLDAEAAPSFAIARGLAIHRLLQVLPGLAEPDREAAARRYLERAGGEWSAAERDAAAASVLAILRDADFAPVFAPGSRAEVSVMGTLRLDGRDRAIYGKIDRLAVTADRLMIVDYKTNRPPALRRDEVPPAYVAQLALYRALLGRIHGDRPVRAALLYTEAPCLIELPAATMDEALARLSPS